MQSSSSSKIEFISTRAVSAEQRRLRPYTLLKDNTEYKRFKGLCNHVMKIANFEQFCEVTNNANTLFEVGACLVNIELSDNDTTNNKGKGKDVPKVVGFA